MNATIITQKNVCAFLGLVMALTIVISAQATATVDNGKPVHALAYRTISLTSEEIVMDLQPVEIAVEKEFPTVTLLDKYGNTVAEFYGEKSDLEKKFPESLQQGVFLTAFGNHEFYLVK